MAKAWERKHGDSGTECLIDTQHAAGPGEIMRCPNCGAEVPDVSDFCILCGKSVASAKQSEANVVPSSQAPSPAKPQVLSLIPRSMVPWVIAALAVVVVVMLMAALLMLGNDAVPTYHGTISVHVYNDAWFDRVSCTVYIDDDAVKDSSVGPLNTENWTFSVKWTGESIHEFRVRVVSATNTQTATVDLRDGEWKTVTVTI